MGCRERSTTSDFAEHSAPHPEVRGRELVERPSLEGRSDLIRSETCARSSPASCDAARQRLHGRDGGIARCAVAARFAGCAPPGTLQPAFRALFSADHSDLQRFDEIFAAYWTGHGIVHSRGRRCPASPKTPANASRPLRRAARHPRRPTPRNVARRRRWRRRGAKAAARREGASRAEALAVRRHPPRRRSGGDREDACARRAARQARCGRGSCGASGCVGAGRRLDIRRTIHRSVSHGGTPVELVWRRRKQKPLRLVVLLDASGSMSLYTAFFVRFLHGVVDAFREAEAFVFHTRLAHVSPSLRDRNVTRAVEKLALMAQGIGGGTRIGESLATFNRWHARARHQFAHRRDDRLRRLRHRRAGAAWRTRCGGCAGAAGASSGSIR